MREMGTEKLPTRDEFAEQLGTDFTFSAEGRETTARLDRVSDLEKLPVQERFSIYFTAPGDCGMQQFLYRAIHPVLGEMDLFLVPVALDERGLRLECVFNNLTENFD